MARKITYPRRGEIWLVDFDPTLGAEIQKNRPALIIQNDIGNRASPITIVAAITTTVKRPYPFQVVLPARVSGLNFDSVVTLNQIRSIDRIRLSRKLGFLPAELMRQVDRAVLVSLAIDLHDLLEE
jgi:mRNA interferase MazF